MSEPARAQCQPPNRGRPSHRGHGDRVREDLIGAAMTLIEAKQGEQLTLRGIARHVGIAATSVCLLSRYPTICCPRSWSTAPS
jgi:AcrR family transcriptional regulator